MALDCCCDELCQSCPDGGTLPDSVTVTIAGLGGLWAYMNGSHILTRATTGLQGWLKNVPSTIFDVSSHIGLTCPSGLVNLPGATYQGTPFYLQLVMVSSFIQGYLISAGALTGGTVLWPPTGAYTFSCTPPDIRYPAGSFTEIGLGPGPVAGVSALVTA